MSNRSERRDARLHRHIHRHFSQLYYHDRKGINPRFVLQNREGATLGWLHKHGRIWQLKSSVFPFEWEGEKLAEGAKQFDLYMTITGTSYGHSPL